MRIKPTPMLDYPDVLFEPKRSPLPSRADITLEREMKFPYSPHTFKGIPIIAANMDGVGTFSMALVLQKHKVMTCIRKHYTVEEWDKAFAKGLDPEYTIICTGSNIIHDPKAKDYVTMQKVVEKHPALKYICIDVANGYQENFAKFVAQVREEFPHHVIMAGNVATYEMTEQLILSGADIVKVGIGPGAVCTTRLKTGVGVPQLTAVIECSDAAHSLNGHIIADGGIVHEGDVAKAFGGGADFVMIGSMFAAHAECEETFLWNSPDYPNTNGLEVTMENPRTFHYDSSDGRETVPEWGIEEELFVEFYGMSSERAKEKHGARKDGYRGAEGKLVRLPYRGSIENSIVELLGDVCSTCTMIGARTIKAIPKCTVFNVVRNVVNHSYDRYEV